MANIFKGLIQRSTIKGNNNILNQHIGNTYSGLSYLDVKQIALEIFNENFFRVSDEAAKVAKNRIDEFTGNLLSDIQDINPNGLDFFRDPGMQNALFLAQREYAKSGDHDTGTLLIDLLVQRTLQQKRNLAQIIIDEAIVAGGKITERQMLLLTLVFICQAPIRGFESLSQLIDFFDLFQVKIAALQLIDRDEIYEDLNHLTYTGCISTGSIGSELTHHLLHNYELAFLSTDQLPGIGFKDLFGKNFIPESDLGQIVAKAENKSYINRDDLKLFAVKQGMEKQTATNIVDNLLSVVRPIIHKATSDSEPFASMIQLYKKYTFSSYNLTTVGVSIAKSYIRITYNYDIT